MSMAVWRNRRTLLKKLASTTEVRTKRDQSFSVEGVGGNAKTGIRFYGKGSPTLQVMDNTILNFQQTFHFFEYFLNRNLHMLISNDRLNFGSI